MPELKQIAASIELGTSNTKLKEYGARYSDGHVETFVAVPDSDMPFTLHITTNGYIAPGISFFVFMDGEYQCNRNKTGFKLPGDGVLPHEYETEFRLRQKEEKTSSGSFIAREWSFAKLDTVAADKAPSLNREFVRNVGTIEVVAMRCRPSTEEPVKRSSKPDSAIQKSSSKASKEAPAKPASKPPSKAASKAPSKAAPAEDDGLFGGMFGLFDGACDDMGLDGASDYKPKVRDFAYEQGPPTQNHVWDDVLRETQSGNASEMPGTFPEPASPSVDSARMRAREFIAQAAKGSQHAQMDGPGDWRPPAGGYTGRAHDDLRGDKYLGMTGRDRTDYKQFFRERGDAVTQTPQTVTGVGIMEGYICRDRTVAEEIQHASAETKPSARFFLAAENKAYYENNSAGYHLLSEDLQLMRQDIERMTKANPRVDVSGAWRDWHLLEAKLNAMGPSMQRAGRPMSTAPAPPGVGYPSLTAQEEALEDVALLRTKVQIIGNLGAAMEAQRIMEQLQRAEDRVVEDMLWSKSPSNELQALEVRCEQLRQRQELMQQVTAAIRDADPNYNVHNIFKRIDAVSHEARVVERRIAELRGTGRGGTTPRSHVSYQQGFDGPGWQQSNHGGQHNQSPWGGAAGDNGQDWQEVGEGKRNQSQQRNSQWPTPGHPGTEEHFANQDLKTTKNWAGGERKAESGWGQPAGATGWAAEKTRSRAGAGSKSGHQSGRQDGWAAGSQNQQGGAVWGDDQQANNTWGPSKPGSKAASQGGGGGWTAGGGSQRASQKNAAGFWGAVSGSQRASQRNGHNDYNAGGDDNWDQGGNAGGDGGEWGAQSNKSQSKGGGGWVNQSSKDQNNGGGWGNNAPGSRASGNRSNAAPASRTSSSKPEELIKPYWKTWDKPNDQQSDAANATRRHEVARDAYTYPAVKLPAIPEGKVSSATHGIQTSRGAEYNHVCRRPVYIDTMEKPYAVFSFKYRSKDKLKQITGLNVKSVDDDVKAIEKQAQKDKLGQMPKDQLIEQLMRSSAGKSGTHRSATKSGGQASGAKGWGDKPASNAKAWDAKSQSRKSVGDGWGQENNDPGNAGGGGWSNQSKSKKSEANGWANAGGGWDGQSDAAAHHRQAEPEFRKEEPASGGFKFNYDAYKQDDAPATPANRPTTNAEEHESSTSIFEDPDGVQWKGKRVVGHAQHAESGIKRDQPVGYVAGA